MGVAYQLAKPPTTMYNKSSQSSTQKQHNSTVFHAPQAEKVLKIKSFFAVSRPQYPGCPWAVHGIQSLRGSIPLISTKKSWILLEFTTFSLFSAQKVVVVKFKKHSRPPFRPLVFHLKIKYSRGGISWLVYFLCFHWFFVFKRLCIREPWKTAHTQIGPCNPFCRLDYWQTCFPGVQYT